MRCTEGSERNFSTPICFICCGLQSNFKFRENAQKEKEVYELLVLGNHIKLAPKVIILDVTYESQLFDDFFKFEFEIMGVN